MTRTPRRVAWLTALVVASSCGGGGPSATEWMRDVCTSVGEWKSVLTVAPDIPRDDLAGIKRETVGYLDRAVRATDELIADLDAAGTPDAENGEQFAEGFRRAIAQFRTAFSDARAKAEALAPEDPAAFATNAQQVLTDMQTAITNAGAAFARVYEQHPSTEIQEAGGEVAECNDIVGDGR